MGRNGRQRFDRRCRGKWPPQVAPRFLLQAQLTGLECMCVWGCESKDLSMLVPAWTHRWADADRKDAVPRRVAKATTAQLPEQSCYSAHSNKITSALERDTSGERRKSLRADSSYSQK